MQQLLPRSLLDVFVFPPVTSYHRFLIHQAVEEYPQLASFSIGEGDERRTVLCSKELRAGIPSQASNPLKRSLETTESSADSKGSPKSCREEVEDTKDNTSWGLFGRELRDARFSEATERMDSLQDGVSLEGNPSKLKSKEKNRKPKRATQELYVPRSRRQNTPTGESTASQQPATQAVEKPQVVQEERSDPPGGKQQHREQRKGREGGKGKSQRDRKISAEGEKDEVGEHKGQNKGKHGRKPRKENVKSNAAVSSENTNLSGLDANSLNNAPGKPTLPKSAAETVKTASPVPEDWNEIDYDERDVTCHPTGTRLTSHGKLIPVKPSDDATVPRETLTPVTDMTGDNDKVESNVETDLNPNRAESKVDVVELVSEDCTTRTRSDSVKNKSETEVQSTDTSIQSNIVQDNVSLEDATLTERTISKDKNILSTDSAQNSKSNSTSASENSSVASTTDKTSSENVEPDREMDLSVTPTIEAVGSQNLDQEHEPDNPTEAMQSLKVVDDEQENCPTSCETVPCGTDDGNETEMLESEKPIPDRVESDHKKCEKMGKDDLSVAVETEEASPKEESVRAPGSDEGADGDDDWDALFDESGDCLKPEELQELSEGVGNVQVSVKQSKRDYYHYQPKDNTNYSELEHVIEVYDFPTDFKTQDLVTGFSNMKTKEMDIKWIDDTHALAIFPSSIIAQDAISLSNPMFRTRPLMLASREAKMKARACEEFLLPSKPRPETSAATARRLVSGALGLKTNVPKEQRAAEKQKIKDAKERRRSDKKQLDDIWSGNI